MEPFPYRHSSHSPSQDYETEDLSCRRPFQGYNEPYGQTRGEFLAIVDSACKVGH
ncbi:hypothetical protein M422DRAFT_27477 [Sphaerobolus stellatus SS14]|nr:hypothetical protein M422DRAFT_27477 [Sphaerobolus stellatus SS14]